MKLNRFAPVFLSAILALAGCGTNFISERIDSGSSKPETKEFALTGFSAVQAAAGFTVQLTRADAFSVKVTADDNLWADLDISQSGGTLHLQTKEGVGVRNATLKAVVTMPSLKSLDMSGAASAAVTGFQSSVDFTARLSGAGSLNLANEKFGATTFDISGAGSLSGKAATGDVKFVVSGAGRVSLSGSGAAASIDASGASSLTLDQFAVQNLSVTLSGASEARVNAQNIVLADLSGLSHVFYVGSPKLGTIKTSGGSTIGKE